MTIAENLHRIHEQIATTAHKAGRNPSSVRLVAVSKTKSASQVDEASQAGQRLFGENYVQELTQKAEQVREPVEWHYIGSLQSNKVKYLAGLVTMIHSVDRLSLAEEIDRQWGKLGKVCEILIQVNISREATKGGTDREQLFDLIRETAKLPHIQIRGLMTMPPFFDDPEGARPYFRELRELASSVNAVHFPGVEMKELSMGMSGDFEVAIEEGATLIRVGSAIFGYR